MPFMTTGADRGGLWVHMGWSLQTMEGAQSKVGLLGQSFGYGHLRYAAQVWANEPRHMMAVH